MAPLRVSSALCGSFGFWIVALFSVIVIWVTRWFTRATATNGWRVTESSRCDQVMQVANGDVRRGATGRRAPEEMLYRVECT